MKNTIIDSTEQGIVVKEIPVQLSNEKLKNVLLHTYERAQSDMNDLKIYNYYSIFLSVAGTLIITLLTSSFNSIGPVSSGFLTAAIWVICIGSAITGFVFLGLHVSKMTKNDTEKRDQAIEDMLKNFSQKQ